MRDLVIQDMEKTEVLNVFFASVFTASAPYMLQKEKRENGRRKNLPL